MAQELKRRRDDHLYPRGKYPWDKYMNNSTWVLHRGRDFQTIKKIRTAAYMEASRKDFTVSVHVIDDNTIEITATGGPWKK